MWSWIVPREQSLSLSYITMVNAHFFHQFAFTAQKITINRKQRENTGKTMRWYSHGLVVSWFSVLEVLPLWSYALVFSPIMLMAFYTFVHMVLLMWFGKTYFEDRVRVAPFLYDKQSVPFWMTSSLYTTLSLFLCQTFSLSISVCLCLLPPSLSHTIYIHIVRLG